MERFFRVTAPTLLISTLLIASLMAAFAGSVAPVAAQTLPQDIPRNETLMLGGHEGSPTALRPWDIYGNAGMAFYFMYEPMFGVNVAKGSAPADLVKIVGKSIRWVSPLTIEVKLSPEAKWTDGQPITSYDVEYSYGVYGLASDTKSWVTQGGEGGVFLLKERLASWENVDSKTFRIHIKSAYPNSAEAWTLLTRAYPILPKHVWVQIEAQYGANMRAFTNDWSDPAMPAAWKVASGMFLPTWHDDDHTLMTRNEKWWGKSVFGKLPAVKYIWHTCYHWSNAPAALDLQNNEIDWCGSYMPGIDSIMSAMPQIHTYDPNPPYCAEMSIKLLVPNHRKYPLGEGWLHRAMAMALDYHLISLVGPTSGYLKYPYPYPSHLLPSDDAVAKALVRPEIEQEYAIYNDLNGAIAILEEHCIKGPDGRWYTKEGPSQEWIDLYGADALPYEDALPAVDGINVPLGPWTIMDQQGWLDVLAIDALACSTFKSIGITVTQKVVDWGTNEADGRSFNYDFMHYVMEWNTGTMYERHYQMFVGDDYYWNHYGDYRNPELVDLLGQLDITTGAEQQAVADQILTIMGEEMPIIPFGGHPMWYEYNTAYWLGFSDKETNQILPAGPYGNIATSAILQTVVLNLVPNPEAPPAPPTPVGKLNVKLTGEFDYLEKEAVNIRLAALVRDAATMEPVSNAVVGVEIYNPAGKWVSASMQEKISGSGIYEWTSERTISKLKLPKGVYLVRVNASYSNYPVAYDIMEFHIDPPAEGTNETLYYVTFAAISLVVATGIVLRKRQIANKHR